MTKWRMKVDEQIKHELEMRKTLRISDKITEIKTEDKVKHRFEIRG